LLTECYLLGEEYDTTSSAEGWGFISNTVDLRNP
jgi:hypothetical protein